MSIKKVPPTIEAYQDTCLHGFLTIQEKFLDIPLALQSGAKEMIEIYLDSDGTQQEKDMAYNTLYELIFPTEHENEDN